MKRYLLGALVLAVLALGLSIKRCQTLRDEKNRLSDNQRSLLSGIEFYRTADSLSAASVEKLTLSKKELEQYNHELTKIVESLGLKVKRLESASTTIVKTEITASAPLTDTVIIEKLTPVPVQKFDWSDSWVYVSGIIRDELVTCNVRSVDTLVQVVHRVPRKFWFIKWGTKAIRQEILSKNPHSQIIYTEYIELKK